MQVPVSAVVGGEGEGRGELLDFYLPVAQQARGHYHQGLVLLEFSFFLDFQQVGDNLEGLAEAHVVGQNTAETDFQVLVHPGVAPLLVGA